MSRNLKGFFENAFEDDISDEEKGDFNANKSFELSDDDAPTIKDSYQEENIKETKALLKK